MLLKEDKLGILVLKISKTWFASRRIILTIVLQVAYPINKQHYKCI